MNILIVGGAGFVGANLVRRCLREPGVNITVVDSLDPHLHATTKSLQSVWDRIKFVRGDMREEHLISEVVQGQDVIFNCAAQTSHPLSIQFPLLDADINCVGNLKLLEAIRQLNPKALVVYTSTSTVIGKSTVDLVDETHGERPLEIYSANKSVAEKYYRIYHTLYDLKTVVLRFGNLYGPYGRAYPEAGFINYFINQAWNNEQLKIFGKGQQKRNVTYVGDVVDLMWRSIGETKLIGDTFFVMSDYYVSVHEIAQSIVQAFQKGQVTHVDWPENRKRIEVDDVKYSSAKLRKLMAWEPKHDFQKGVQETLSVLKGTNQ